MNIRNPGLSKTGTRQEDHRTRYEEDKPQCPSNKSHGFSLFYLLSCFLPEDLSNGIIFTINSSSSQQESDLRISPMNFGSWDIFQSAIPNPKSAISEPLDPASACGL
jgi:hypothetical protein